MKHFTLAFLTLFLFGTVHAQLVDSDFSTWESDLPTGWAGSKTNIGNENIMQADNNGGQGDFAVELVNADGSHKRFSTQQLTVESGTNYSITFWARGAGDLRTGLFDDREDGFGYVYNSYITIDSDTWGEFSQNIVAAEDTDIAEFILSVRNTSGDFNLQVDRVVIEAGDIETVAIYDIQFSEDPEGASPLVDQSVTTRGVVSAVGADGYFLQNGSGPWNGIFVFSFDTPSIGDTVVVTGNVVEYFGLTQLSGTTGYTVLNSGNAVQVTDVSTQQVNEEGYEGVLVRVQNATCTDANSGFGQWIVNDGSGSCLINPEIYEYDPMLNAVYNITGVIFYSFDEFKIMPRDAGDITVTTAVAELSPEGGVNVFPNPVADQLTIAWAETQGAVAYNVFDISGKHVAFGAVDRPLGQIDVSFLEPGMYSLQLESGQSVLHTRILVER